MTISLEEFIIKAGNVITQPVVMNCCMKGNKVLSKNGLYVEWRIGGIGGGSCWGTENNDPHYALSGDDEPDFIELDSFLEKVCPSMTFLQYKNIISRCLKSYEYTITEYYGNNSVYKVKWICLENLYNILIEKNII